MVPVILFWYACLILSTGSGEGKYKEQPRYVFHHCHFSINSSKATGLSARLGKGYVKKCKRNVKVAWIA
jgi:hypothetical protein